MYNRATRGRQLVGGLDQKQVCEVANGASGVYAQITQGSTALTGTLRGIYAVATNGTTTGTGTIRGAEIKARAADPSGNGANIDGLTGVYVSVDVKTKTGTTIRGFEVSLDGANGGSSTLAQGLVIFNNSSAAQTTSIAVDVNGGTPTDHKAFTSDFRLQNGALIDNAVSGVLAFTVAAITFSGTLNVVGNFSVNTTKFTVNATSADLSSYNQEADATGTTWTVKKSRAAGAACSNNDVLLDIIAQGMNATPALVTVAELKAILTDKTAGSEDGSLSFLTAVNGALAERLSIADVVNSTVNFQVGTDKFVVTASSGATVLKSTFGAGTNGTTFTVAADGSLAIATTGFTVSAAGAVVAASTVKSTGDFTVGASKFVVTAASGNTLLKGTIGAGTNGTEFTVAADGSIAVVSTMFTVSAAGAVNAKGAVAFGANLTEFGISTAGDITSYNKEADASGTYWISKKSRAAGAVCVATDTIYQLDLQGMNATPALKTVGNMVAQIMNVGAGTESGRIFFSTMFGGAAASVRLELMADVTVVLPEAAGATSFIVTDSAAATRFSVNSLGDIASKNIEVDATGVTWTATKARAAAVCSANDVIWQLIASGMNTTPAQKAVVNLKALMTGVTAGAEAGAFTVETVTGGATIAEVFRVDGTGIVLPATVTRGIRVGSSATASGSGVALNATNYQGSGFFADDGGVAMTAGSTESVMVRHILTKVVAGGIAVSASALHASQWVYANYTGIGNLSGVWAHFLIPTGVTIDNSAGARAIVSALHASLDLASGSTLAASSQAAGVSVSGNLGGTITGVASGVRVLAPSAGNWTYGIDLNGMGTPTADVRFRNAATLNNSAAGALDLALGTIAGTDADNGLGITLTDSTTFGTGVGNAVSLLVTAGGSRTGGASTRFNGILDQVTVAGTGNINGMYIRMPLSGSPNLATNLVSGLVVDMKELGATDYFSNIFLHKFNTTKGTGLDAFIVCALQELGVAKTGIYFQGINLPDNFLTIQPGGARDMLVAAEPTGTTKRYLKVDIDGVAYAIICNSVA